MTEIAANGHANGHVILGPNGQPYQLADTTTRRNRARLTKEMGQGGVTYFNGFVSNDEFNDKLTFPEGVLTYDKMRRTDAQVQALLYAIGLPITSADWDVVAGDDETPEEQVDFVRENLFERINFDRLLKHLMTSVPLGFAWAEKVYELDDWLGEDKLMFSKIAARLATSVERWETNKKEELTAIVQQVDDGKGHQSEEVTIPFLSKAIVFSFQMEANNYEGMSILRSAYKHWFIKDQIYHIDAIRIERFALGMPHFTLPEEFDNDALDALTEAGKNWKAGSQSYLITPFGVEVQILTVPQGSVLDVLPTINHHNEEIGKSGLAQFINFGRSGNRGLGEAAQEFFYDALKNLAKFLESNLDEQVIDPLLALNFRNPGKVHARASNIGAVSLPQLIRFLREVGEVFITPDRNIEDHLRDQFALPARDEETPSLQTERTEKKDDAQVAQTEQNIETSRAIANNPGEHRGGGPRSGGSQTTPRRAGNRPLDNRSRTGNRTVREEPSRRVQRFLDQVESGEFNDSPEWPAWIPRAIAQLAKEHD